MKLVLTLGAKSKVKPKRDDNFQCGVDFYPKFIIIQPKLLLTISHVYTIGPILNLLPPIHPRLFPILLWIALKASLKKKTGIFRLERETVFCFW